MLHTYKQPIATAGYKDTMAVADSLETNATDAKPSANIITTQL